MEPYEFARWMRQYLLTSVEGDLHLEKITGLQGFLDDPTNAWLSTEDLTFMCNTLGIRNSAFFVSGWHQTFLTHVDRNDVGIYDPMREGIQHYPFGYIADDPHGMTVTRDILHAWMKQRTKKPQGYSLPDYLVESRYEKGTFFLEKMGRIQDDGVNCIPLSVYAAAQALRPRVIRER